MPLAVLRFLKALGVEIRRRVERVDLRLAGRLPAAAGQPNRLPVPYRDLDVIGRRKEPNRRDVVRNHRGPGELQPVAQRVRELLSCLRVMEAVGDRFVIHEQPCAATPSTCQWGWSATGHDTY